MDIVTLQAARAAAKRDGNATYEQALPAMTITRDATGRITSAEVAGQTETYTRDATGRVAVITRGDVSRTVTRDATGRIVGVA